MRIAFISYEYPIDTGGGGIGSYLEHVAGLLCAAGHEVEVFCGTPGTSRAVLQMGCPINLVHSAGSVEFKDEVLETFSQSHREKPYDVIEGCDFDASALRIKQQHPALPYVVKLHTPRFFVDELHHVPTSYWVHLRMTLGALRRGQWPAPHVSIQGSTAARVEIEGIALADEVAAPSAAIAREASTWCGANLPPVSVFPLPFSPAPALLDIPPTGSTHRVTFIGRMEARKGVLDLAAAIPSIARRVPGALFRFVGRDQPLPDTKIGMQEKLRRMLTGQPAEVFGPVAHGEVPRLFRETDIAVFPSHWENHAMICCEAMAAGRAVVASNSGGMTELLDEGRCGVLVPPRQPELLAEAITRLLNNPEEQARLGREARRRILNQFSPASVLAQQIASYEAAITACRRRHPSA